MLVGRFRIAVIDKCQPEFEGIDLGAVLVVIGQPIQRFCQGTVFIPIAVDVDALTEGNLDPGRGLE